MAQDKETRNRLRGLLSDVKKRDPGDLGSPSLSGEERRTMQQTINDLIDLLDRLLYLN